MRGAFAYLLVACVALALIRGALAVLLVLLLMEALWLAATRPREMAGFLCLVAVISLIQNHGIALLLFIMVVSIIRTIQLYLNQLKEQIIEKI